MYDYFEVFSTFYIFDTYMTNLNQIAVHYENSVNADGSINIFEENVEEA